AIPHAVALVRGVDMKSPREAVEFILQLLKLLSNDWQSVSFLSPLVKRIDRLLQFDRLMPSYNGILTVSCIRTLTQIALKLSEFISLDRIIDLINPFCSSKPQWQVRIEAFRSLLDLEYHCKGIDAALILFVKCLEEEPSLRGQVKLGVHAMRLCQISGDSDDEHCVMRETLVALLRLLESPAAFNNVTLRHYLFCILQVLAGRPPTLCGVPRDETLIKGHTEICNELKNFFAAIVNQSKPPEESLDVLMLPYDGSVPETNSEPNIISITDNERIEPEELTSTVPDATKEVNDNSSREQNQPDIVILDSSEAHKEPDTVSNGQDRKKPVLKIKMKQSSASSRAEEADNVPPERSQGAHNGADHGNSSSVSMDAPPPPINFTEPENVGNQNLDDVNSCHDLGSRVTASIGSAKLAGDVGDHDGGDALMKELQCTADSSKVQSNDGQTVNRNNIISLRILNTADSSKVQSNNVDTVNHNNIISLRVLNKADDLSLAGPSDKPVSASKEKKEKKKKDKEKKRKRKDEHKSRKDKDDPEYLEKKRLKKEKKRKEKELAKMTVRPSTDVKHQEKPEAPREEVVVGQVTNGATPLDEVPKRTEDKIIREDMVVGQVTNAATPLDEVKQTEGKAPREEVVVGQVTNVATPVDEVPKRTEELYTMYQHSRVRKNRQVKKVMVSLAVVVFVNASGMCI
ncbi:transcription initiation factor TFIID subunit 2 isoform X2, partial [Tanacetum coccineum]